MEKKTTLKQFLILSDSQTPIIIERSDESYTEAYRGTIYGLYHDKKLRNVDNLIISSIYPAHIKLKQVNTVHTFLGMKVVCHVE